MKIWIAILTLATAFSVQASEKEIQPVNSRCLTEAAAAAENYLNTYEEPGYVTLLDEDDYPYALENESIQNRYDRFGIWLSDDQTEFVQFGNDSMTINVTMKFNAELKSCEVLEVEPGQNDWD